MNYEDKYLYSKKLVNGILSDAAAAYATYSIRQGSRFATVPITIVETGLRLLCVNTGTYELRTMLTIARP